MEAGEHGLTRGTCFVARRLEVVAVAWLLWISGCVSGGAFFFFFFFDFFFFERTRPAASMRPPCLIYLSTSTAVDDCTELRYSSVFTSSARAGKYRGSGCTTYNAHSILG